MKKLLSLLLVLVMCVAVFAACRKKPQEPDGLELAKEYIRAMYLKSAEVTPSDYERMSIVAIDGVQYNVTWTTDKDEVKIVAGEKGTVTVDVDEKAPAELKYVLKATIADANGKTTEITFNHKVPAFKETTWAEYAAAEKDAIVIVKGVITGIMAKSKGNSNNCLYLQDNEGGFYVYNLATDPITDEKLELGMTVRVTGAKDTYSGTYEVMNGKVEIVDSNKTTVAAADYTDKFAKATGLKDSSIVEKQALLVTIKGVEITGQEASSGYYKFKLGDLESYIRISSSVCPITKDEQKKLIDDHAAHLGWIANVTGVICVYDGAFYLTPVDVNAFEYVSLPKKSDAEMAAFEKDNITLPTAITDNTTITLDANGKSYDTVAITWASDNACAVITDGKLTVTLPEEEAKVKITATLKCGNETVTKVFEITVDAASKTQYIAKNIDAPAAGKTFKFALVQANLGKTLYFTGAMDGNYFATSDKADKAADVTIEEVTGGFRLYFTDGDAKKYIDIYEYTAGKVGVQLTDKPNAVFTWNDELKIFIANVAGADYYLGTYKTYNTISASKTSYITGDKKADIGVSQFPAHLATLAMADYKVSNADAPKAGANYKFALVQANLGKTLYFTGAMDGNYFATSDKLDKAKDVTVEEVTSGFRLYFTDGDAKKYIDIYEYTAGKVGVQLTDKPNAVFTWNDELKVFVANVAGADYYLGTYKTYNTISASKTSYITGDKKADIGVSQFPAHICEAVLAEVKMTAVEAPKAGESFKFALEQTNLGKTLYFTGAMDGNYFATSDKLDKAVDVTIEEVTGGFRLSYADGDAKKYIDIYEYTAGKVGVQLTDKPNAVFTWNDELKIFVANVAGSDYYLGTYKTYNTISASKTSYITGDKKADIGVSQFPAHLVAFGFAD